MNKLTRAALVLTLTALSVPASAFPGDSSAGSAAPDTAIQRLEPVSQRPEGAHGIPGPATEALTLTDAGPAEQPWPLLAGYEGKRRDAGHHGVRSAKRCPRSHHWRRHDHHDRHHHDDRRHHQGPYRPHDGYLHGSALDLIRHLEG